MNLISEPIMTKRALGWTKLRDAAKRLPRADSGLAAVEFALLLPVMVMFYLGGLEISMAVSTYRLVDLTADTVTNLVTQYTTISQSAQMPDILQAATQVMYPVSAADPNVKNNIGVVVSLISIDKNGNATVAWSQTLNGARERQGRRSRCRQRSTFPTPVSFWARRATLSTR